MPKKKTQEQFEKDVFDKLGSDYELLSPYPGGHGKVLMRHKICDNTFYKNVHDIMSKKSGCPYCNGSKPALYNEEWVINHTPLPYRYISGYQGMSKKCKFYCVNCKIEFEQQPQKLINQHLYGCNCCSTKKKTHEEFLEELGKECLQEYEIKSIYTSVDNPIEIKHLVCGYNFTITPYQFIHKHQKVYCPICYYKKSKGEVKINLYLNQNQIEYKKEHQFSNLPLYRFDFYLPDLKIAIEYDGKQHFEPIDYYGGIDALRETQYRDKIKNQFCLDNNITLFRIPYTEINNINTILIDIFEKKSSTTIEKFKITEQSKDKIS